MSKKTNKCFSKKFSKGYCKTKRMNNMHIGGSMNTAKKFFEKKDNFNKVKVILTEREKELLELDLGVDINPNVVFKAINIYFLKYQSENSTKLINKYIDFIIQSYVNNTFGNPSSVENIGRFIQSIELYESIKNNKPIYDTVVGFQFKGLNVGNKGLENSLLALEDYLAEEKTKEVLDKIHEKNSSKDKQKMREKEIKEKGENNVIIVLDTDKFTIYQPTDKWGAMYWGRKTQWCTAGYENNMFDYYRKDGIIYIIISKADPSVKYQIHFESDQVMNDKDKHVDITEIIGKIEFNGLYPADEIDVIFEKKVKEPNNQEYKLEYEYKLKSFFNDNIDNIIEQSNIYKWCINLINTYPPKYFINASVKDIDKMTNLKIIILNNICDIINISKYASNLYKIETLIIKHIDVNLKMIDCYDETNNKITWNRIKILLGRLRINTLIIEDMDYVNTDNLYILLNLEGIKNISVLQLNKYNDSHYKLTGLKVLKNLEKLVLLEYNSSVDDIFTLLPNLNTLIMDKFNNKLNNIKNLTNLKFLRLYNYDGFKDKNIGSLIGLSKLEILILPNLGNNIEITFLQNKQNLKKLNLGNVELYNVDITNLIQSYNYDNHMIETKTVHLFDDLINLETLYLNYMNLETEQYETNNNIIDKKCDILIDCLNKMPKLKELYFTKTFHNWKPPKKQINMIKTMFPNIKIIDLLNRKEL